LSNSVEPEVTPRKKVKKKNMPICEDNDQILQFTAPLYPRRHLGLTPVEETFSVLLPGHRHLGGQGNWKSFKTPDSFSAADSTGDSNRNWDNKLHLFGCEKHES
jgi:hypothetical protein